MSDIEAIKGELAVSPPSDKDWARVERIKEERILLHQRLLEWHKLAESNGILSEIIVFDERTKGFANEVNNPEIKSIVVISLPIFTPQEMGRDGETVASLFGVDNRGTCYVFHDIGNDNPILSVIINQTEENKCVGLGEALEKSKGIGGAALERIGLTLPFIQETLDVAIGQIETKLPTPTLSVSPPPDLMPAG